MKLNLTNRLKAIATFVEKEVVLLENVAENVVVPFLVKTTDAIAGKTLEPTGHEAEDLFLEAVQIISKVEKLNGNAALIQQVAEVLANAIDTANKLPKEKL